MDLVKPRVRFAPSPTGELHVGNARTALYNWLFARRLGGDFLLRIEDTDLERSEARYEAQLIEDLRWLGIDWDEGPGTDEENGGPYGPYRQSERLAIYREHANRLLAEGSAYRCFCTPEQLEAERAKATAEHRPQIYSGRCRDVSSEESDARAAAGEPFAIRLRIAPEPIRFHDMIRGDVEFTAEAVSDPVLVRSSGIPVYNFVVAIDDAHMRITHVIRGDDHLSNTPKQVAVFHAFGWPVPQFAHLSTILGPDKARLSKRHGATSIASFRQMGILPEALVNALALLGWGAEGGAREIFTPEELIREFTLERITPSPAVFDFQKLYWLNRHYIKSAAPDRLAALARPYFVQKGWLSPDSTSPEVDAWFRQLLEIFTPSVDRLEELPEKAGFVFHLDPVAAIGNPENTAILASATAKPVLEEFAGQISAVPSPVTAETFKASINEVKAVCGVKGKDLFHPIRIALTGSHSGPEFDKLVPLIETGSQLALPAFAAGIHQRVQRFLDALSGASRT
jgi:glutamyl-tRNA synthetase/nondiscriminating glutamyl-tRNA synthetase